MANMNIGTESSQVNLVISGDLSTKKIYLPSAAGGSSLTQGTANQVIKSNGSSSYWATQSLTVSNGVLTISL